MIPQKAAETIFFLHGLNRNGFQKEFTELMRLQWLIAVDKCNYDDRVIKALLGEQFVDFSFEKVYDTLVFMSLVVFPEKFEVVKPKSFQNEKSVRTWE